jgi:hypothetical protein
MHNRGGEEKVRPVLSSSRARRSIGGGEEGLS